MEVAIRLISESDGCWKYEMTYKGVTREAEIMPDLSGKPGYLLIVAQSGFKRTSHRHRKPTIYGAYFATQAEAVQGAEDWMRTQIGRTPSVEQDTK